MEFSFDIFGFQEQMKICISNLTLCQFDCH